MMLSIVLTRHVANVSVTLTHLTDLVEVCVFVKVSIITLSIEHSCILILDGVFSDLTFLLFQELFVPQWVVYIRTVVPAVRCLLHRLATRHDHLRDVLVWLSLLNTIVHDHHLTLRIRRSVV